MSLLCESDIVNSELRDACRTQEIVTYGSRMSQIIAESLSVKIHGENSQRSTPMSVAYVWEPGYLRTSWRSFRSCNSYSLVTRLWGKMSCVISEEFRIRCGNLMIACMVIKTDFEDFLSCWTKHGYKNLPRISNKYSMVFLLLS